MLKQLDPCNMIIMQSFHCANDTLCCNIPRRHDEELPFWLIRIHERKGLASINEENKHNVWNIVWTAIMIIVQKYMCSPICTLWACLLSTRCRMLAKLCEIYLEQTCQQNWCNTTAFRLMKPHLEHTKTGCLTSSFWILLYARKLDDQKVIKKNKVFDHDLEEVYQCSNATCWLKLIQRGFPVLLSVISSCVYPQYIPAGNCLSPALGLLSLQNKAFFNQHTGHLGSGKYTM